MARHRAPANLKVLRGVAKKGETDGFEPSGGIGAPPSHLSEYEKKIWDEVVSQLPFGVLGDSDRLSLEFVCRLVSEMRLNFEEMTASKLTQLSSMLGRFGMTPSDRNKIVVPKGEKKSGFEGM